MADRSGLKFVGFIFATVTLAVMLTTGMVVQGYADGGYAPETTLHCRERVSCLRKLLHERDDGALPGAHLDGEIVELLAEHGEVATAATDRVLLLLGLHDGAGLERLRLGCSGSPVRQRYDRRSEKQGEVRLADGRRPGRKRAPVQGAVLQAGTITASGGQRSEDNGQRTTGGRP